MNVYSVGTHCCQQKENEDSNNRYAYIFNTSINSVATGQRECVCFPDLKMHFAHLFSVFCFLSQQRATAGGEAQLAEVGTMSQHVFFVSSYEKWGQHLPVSSLLVFFIFNFQFSVSSYLEINYDKLKSVVLPTLTSWI